MAQYDQRGQHIHTQYNVGRDLNVVVPAVSQATVLELNNRKIMLDRVEQIWITGLLEKSLYQQVQILLDLHVRPHAVSNPWHFVVQELAPSTGPLPAELSIQDAYDYAGGALLLLGEPGAGKTTLLLELLRMLLQRARQDDAHPIPVVFNLSSWTARRLPLDRWFVEELNSKYQIPRPLAQAWIRQYSILPLLDGLDEVMPAARAACVDAINIYQNAYGLTPLVVCCRQAEYDGLIAKTQQKLHLRTAVQIQPLTPQHIDTYLSDAGPALAALNTAIQKNPTLQELVTSPLMLSVLSLAYQDASPDEIQITDEHQVFALYVQRMLTRRGVHARYTAEQTKKWLARLAQKMVQRGQTEFYLEQLQKDWFPHEKIYRLCIGLASGIVAGLCIFLMYAATFSFQPEPLSEKIGRALLFGLFNVGILTFLYGVVSNVLSTTVTTISAHPAKRILSFAKGQLARLFDNRIFYGLLIGATGGLLLLRYLNFWPPYALLHALFLSIGYMLVGRVDAGIRPVEAIQWSWKSVRINLVKLFGGGLFCGLLFGLITGPFSVLISAYRHNDATILTQVLSLEQIRYSLLVSGITGCGFGIIFTLIGGISYVSLDKSKHITPNQGIHSSARNSLVLGLSTGLLVGLVAALIFGPITAWISETTFGFHYSRADVLVGVGWGIGCGIAMFTVTGLRNGGLVCIQHFLLRFLLWRIGALPWHYTRFLDVAASHILLYRVGGGYRFIHQLFLGYFASLAPIPTQIQATAYTSQEASLRAPLQGVKAAWFVRLGVIAFLVFCVAVGWYGIDSYRYRTQIDHVMATSPYPTAFPGHGTIKFYDPLSEPNQWDNCFGDAQGDNPQYIDNAVHIRETHADHYVECDSTDSFSEFAFSVNMTIIRGDCGGISLGDGNGLGICADGTYYDCVNLNCYDHQYTVLSHDKHVIPTGLNKSTILGIVFRGKVPLLFVNGQNIRIRISGPFYSFGGKKIGLMAVNSTPYSGGGGGEIGLMAVSFTQAPTEVVYKDAKVWTF